MLDQKQDLGGIAGSMVFVYLASLVIVAATGASLTATAAVALVPPLMVGAWSSTLHALT